MKTSRLLSARRLWALWLSTALSFIRIAHDLIEAGTAKEDIRLNMYATPRPLAEKLAA